MSTLIIGAGYTGKPLARLLAESGEYVVATQTDSFQLSDVTSRVYRLGHSDQLRAIIDEFEGSFRCVFTAGPPRMDSNNRSLELFQECLETLPNDRLVNFLFLSSTSVYGDAGGEWVTETTPLDPVSQSGALKRDAESLIESTLKPDVPVVHARIGGIYGPGRNPAKRYLSEDYRLVGGGHRHSNRIHRADLVRALAILARQTESGPVNLTDRKPIRLKDILTFLYRETDHDPATIKSISWEQAEDRYSEMRLGLLKPRKKVSSQKLRGDVGFEFEYPTAYQGFRSLPPIAPVGD